jgi:probable F420-dependent oxidoreductase
MQRLRVGVQLSPQHTTYTAYAQVVRQVEELGVDTIWNWDHFLPPYFGEPPEKNKIDPPHGNHFEAWTLLTAMATLTQRAEVGCLVTCNSYRNPALLANMAKTVDHISNGRVILGLGSGWFEPDYREYGYTFGTAHERLKSLEAALPIIKQHWVEDMPLPVRSTIPILIGGDGERVTLRLTAQYADMWNSGADPEEFKHKCAVLDTWCDKLGRQPTAIERTVNIFGEPSMATYDEYMAAGAQHIILNVGPPWDLTPVEQLVKWRDSRQTSL